MSFRSKLLANGRITVPAAVRRRLGITPGSLIEWVVDEECVVVRKAGEFSSADIHRAIFKERPKFRTDKELMQGIARHLRNKHARG